MKRRKRKKGKKYNALKPSVRFPTAPPGFAMRDRRVRRVADRDRRVIIEGLEELSSS